MSWVHGFLFVALFLLFFFMVEPTFQELLRNFVWEIRKSKSYYLLTPGWQFAFHFFLLRTLKPFCMMFWISILLLRTPRQCLFSILFVYMLWLLWTILGCFPLSFHLWNFIIMLLCMGLDLFTVLGTWWALLIWRFMFFKFGNFLVVFFFFLLMTWKSVQWNNSGNGRATPLPFRDSLVAQMGKSLPARRETWVWFLSREDPLEKERATHSSVLALKIPWPEEPCGLQSMG